jgi:Cu+-exporting ATPase
MKSLMGAALAATVLFSNVALAKEATSTMKVSGWHCGGCGAKTEAALKKVKGVSAAKADRDASTVTVTYDDAQAKPADLEAAIAALHYKVEKDTPPAAK